MEKNVNFIYNEDEANKLVDLFLSQFDQDAAHDGRGVTSIVICMERKIVGVKAEHAINVADWVYMDGINFYGIKPQPGWDTIQVNTWLVGLARFCMRAFSCNELEYL